MANRITDIKLLFDTYDCKPGRAGFEAFKRELLGSAGTTDDQGWSLADCLLRQRTKVQLMLEGSPLGGLCQRFLRQSTPQTTRPGQRGGNA